MKFIFKTFFLLLLVTAKANASTPNCLSFKGQWVNEKGSVLTFDNADKASGSLTGSYISSTGTEGSRYPLIGWYNHSKAVKGKNNATSISFSVRWGSHGSITSWTGTCSIKNGKPSISAIWNLVRSNSDYAWDHMLTNHIIFVPK